MIVAGVQRFLGHACAAPFRVIPTSKTPCELSIYTQTLIGVIFDTETVTYMRVLHEDEICFTLMDTIFKRL